MFESGGTVTSTTIGVVGRGGDNRFAVYCSDEVNAPFFGNPIPIGISGRYRPELHFGTRIEKHGRAFTGREMIRRMNLVNCLRTRRVKPQRFC